MRKRTLNGDGTEPEKKRRCSTRARALPLFVQELAHDAASFLSVVPDDIFSVLRPFLRCRGRVANPAALRFDRELQPFDVKFVYAGMLHFDRDDALLMRMRRVDPTDRVPPVPIVEDWQDAPQPSDCVEDSSGRLFVSHVCSYEVIVYDARGKRTGEIGKNLAWPRCMALSMDESVLYVATWDAPKVYAYGVKRGAQVRDIGEGYVTRPTGVAVLSDNNIVVSSCARPAPMWIFAPDGALVRSFAHYLLCPIQIAVDYDNNIYVTDANTDQVTVYSSADGRLIGHFGSTGCGAGQFVQPVGIAIDSTGTVAVTENNSRRVQLFKSA